MHVRTAFVLIAAAGGVFVAGPAAYGDPTTRPAETAMAKPSHLHPGGPNGHRPMTHDGPRPPQGRPEDGRPRRGDVDRDDSADDDKRAIEALTKQVRDLTAAVKSLRDTIADESRHDGGGDHDRRGGHAVERDDDRHPFDRDGRRDDPRDDPRDDRRDDREDRRQSRDDEDDHRGGPVHPHFFPAHRDFDHLSWHHDWRDRA